MKKKCTSCILYDGKINKVLQENNRLLNIIEVLKSELSDKAEWIENIKNEVSSLNLDDKDLKDRIFKIKKHINKLA